MLQSSNFFEFPALTFSQTTRCTLQATLCTIARCTRSLGGRVSTTFSTCCSKPTKTQITGRCAASHCSATSSERRIDCCALWGDISSCFTPVINILIYLFNFLSILIYFWCVIESWDFYLFNFIGHNSFLHVSLKLPHS